MNQQFPLAGLRIIESSILGPAAITTALVDLGAEVIKVESPSGDYIREMTWPIIEGVSLMHYHLNRGKKSITLDLKQEEARQIYRDLVKDADVVIEASKPGALAKYGLGYEDLKKINPKIVFITVSGYGMTGPYRDMPSHGIAYDTWAGVVMPAYDEEGYCYIPEHVSIGINAAPLFGGLGVLAGVIRARATGEGCFMELAQSDAAAAFDWYRSESYMAYARPEDVVTGNKSDGYKRRPVATAGMKEGVRYQMYESKDGHVLFMASEQAFWKNFCEGLGRADLFEKWPGSKFADHARGNRELQAELRDIFKTRTTREWLAFGIQANTPLAPVNTPRNIVDDPQFQDRFKVWPHEEHGADMLGFPVQFVGERMPEPAKAPTVGQHSDEVLRDVLGYDAAKIAAIKANKLLG
ncbi:L-carnitine dehydratase/bile acid-inducible protein F [Sterolibacterium denitrificans]|uniref:L-carnitine dehydratase/bile acid-inducible protein F n=1 Tax=Sterolibacterium denitrificans TaxID=157592 RepID=A0A7Z7MTX1_9PROT|nr:CoA transferase [Sterolibacterium denitrificans]SMB21136.1 L-carnitine dehydratase/bile acid-inducible protein F [Sterolibacterium denitrificans]